MKRYIIALIVMVIISACRKDEFDVKEGVSLPTVENLKSEAVGTSQVKLSWQIPQQIPSEIERPLKVFLEVNKIIGPTKHISVFSHTIEEEATSFLFDIPTDPGEYHVVVKLNGTTVQKDKNYSQNIFSLGQTIVLKK
ncbi:DUF4945 domain-containing protein [Sphingobacterium daejeonense]|jgi:hypothetical protein|uniref:DUF4945 domain-containing protein n=1 Tax=Sphingobacterium daejeonense TaxID=371142 RepID=UPI0021A441AC|nr:DUF4945 domain-containing protein [Sphingobacterium daejeonense]MCT1530435.1 DUF4945 domain-containing protein [Sphingobacterium daejeonense]